MGIRNVIWYRVERRWRLKKLCVGVGAHDDPLHNVLYSESAEKNAVCNRRGVEGAAPYIRFETLNNFPPNRASSLKR